MRVLTCRWALSLLTRNVASSEKLDVTISARATTTIFAFIAISLIHRQSESMRFGRKSTATTEARFEKKTGKFHRLPLEENTERRHPPK